MIYEILRSYREIIVETEFLTTNHIKGTSHYRCKILLLDGSNLRISERWNENELEQYSYYWLDDENKLIIGWDNAPHHQEIPTYPYHKHIHSQTNVHPSDENNLTTVLNFIKQRIE